MNFFQSLTAVLTPLGVVWMVIILGLATFLHELAHYALAKWQGVAVKSFSVGMGPVLWRRAWRGTEWRLSALPLGGYVEIDGMTPVQGPDGQMHPPTTGYAALPTLGKIAVILAGPLMNLALALALMTFAYNQYGSPQVVHDQVEISEVVKGSRAEKLGLRSGDLITAIDGQDIPESTQIAGKTAEGWQLLPETLKTAGTHAFTVQRGQATQVITFPWQPTVGGQKQLLGIRFGPKINLVKLSLPVAASTAVNNTVQAVPQVLKAFGNLFKRFLTLDLSRDQGVSGPIGTAEIVSKAAAVSPWALLEVAIMLNLSLAFFNLIPIPGLDGGRILLALIGAVKGSPLTFAQENAINFAGFAFVMLLMVFVVVRDVSRFF